MRRVGVAFILLGSSTLLALYPTIAGEGRHEANHKPAWLAWALLSAFVCAGIGLFLLIRAGSRVDDNRSARRAR